ncbi:hypothetical protein [Clostridium sp.]|uniref:hypothetical protein n=1 Tax=Clostridium sp. TaxID=1506 RepID=UPI0025C163FA|nr:hypothetical protein [Clostridium sp.]
MDILIESLKLGVAPSIVVLIYLVINKILDTKKESKQAKLNNNIIDSFNKLNAFLDYITKDIINKDADKRNVGIKNAFERFENNVTKFAISTIIHNNIEINKDVIIDNTKHIISSEFYSLYNTLALYSTTKFSIIEHVEPKWKEDLTNDIIDIIFKNNFTKEQKIYNICNKLEIKLNEYKTKLLMQHIDETN